MSSDDDQSRVYPAGPFERLRDIVDRSIAMFLFRRLTGRPTEVADRRPFPPDLSGDEIAYRLRMPGATSRPIPPPVVTVLALPSVVRASRQPGRPPAKSGSWTRRRLVRDSGITLAGLIAVVVVAIAVRPTADGGVLGAIATPGPDIAVAPPSQVPVVAGQEALLAPVPVLSESPIESPAAATPSETPLPEAGAAGGSSAINRPPSQPGPSATGAPGHAPTPTKRPTVGPATTPTPYPISSSTPTPTPTPTAVSTPFPQPQPTPVSTPTPDPTPTPTPDPTPTPTPDPTPTPTPDPTPTPTPTPDPTPTPTPTPTPDPTPEPSPTP